MLTASGSLTRRRSVPPGAEIDDWTADDRWPVRTMGWRRPDERASLLFIGGRADFIEKYSESCWAWTVDAGLNLATFDWRGQGGSGRLGGDAHRGHAEGFERWVADLDGLLAWSRKSFPGPHVVVAHSMGAHLLLRHLARGGAAPDRAVLLAPMMGINLPLRPALLAPVARFAVAAGLGRRYGPLQRGYGERQRSATRRALLTGSEERFDDEHWWIDRHPELALGGVTWGWLASALGSIATLDAPGALESVKMPALVLIGADERLVDADAAKRTAARLPNARLIEVPDGRHELLRDADAPRRETLAAIAEFIAG